ncbi:MAG: IS3 family transposase [Oligoflexia bacterium]|nr:IS3 family transposase [Oligoflexia bacterium]
MELRDLIEEIHLELPGYGYRRIREHLLRNGKTVNGKRIRRVMKKYSLFSCLQKFMKIRGGPFFTQKISLVVTRIRDEHILQTIAELLNKYQRVLIIYGSSHYRLQHQALKVALGQPKDITPN